MVSAIRFIIIVIICHIERCVLRKWINNPAAQRIAAIFVINKPLGVHSLFLRVPCISRIIRIKISVGIDTGHIVYGGSNRRLDAGIQRRRIEGQASPAADADNADTLRVNIFLHGKEIHRRLEILCIDIR